MIITIAAMFAAAFGSQYWFYRKSFGPATRRIKSRNLEDARKEALTLLSAEMAENKNVVEFFAAKAMIDSTYRKYNVGSIPPAEIQAFFDDLITSFMQNPFISLSRRNELSRTALVLKEALEKREADLGEAIDNWRQVSVFKILMRVVFTLAVGVFAGLTTFILLTLAELAMWDNLVESLWLIVIAAALFSSLQYRKAKEKRDESSHNLHMVLEENIARALERHMPNAVVEANVTAGGTRNLVDVDLIINMSGTRVPVGIKHRLLGSKTIEKLANAMERTGSEKGLLVTSSLVGDKTKKLARQKGIIVLDNVASEDQIVNRLKRTKLFD